MWLASPLLSLVDTAAVGASRPTAELAVLGPACAACDNAAFLCTFLGIVTTGAVSRALATGDETKAKTASGAACVAALVVGGSHGGGLLAAWPCWFRSDGAPVDAGLFRGRRLYPYPIFGVCAGVAHHGVAIDLIGARAASFFTRFDSWRECYFVIFRTRKNIP